MNFLRSMRTRFASRESVRRHGWQSLANYTQQGFGLIFGVIMARILEPSDFGAFGFAAATVVIALIPANWSLAPTLVTDGGKTPSLFRHATGFAWCAVFAKILIVFCLFSVFRIYGMHQTANLCLIFGLSESFKDLNNIQRGYLEGMGIFKANLVSAIASVAFCFIIVIPISLLGIGPYTLSIPGIGGIILDFFIYRHYSKKSIFSNPKWNIERALFHQTFSWWITYTSETILTRFDSWLVGKRFGSSALGDYNRAFGYTPVSHMVLSSLITNAAVVGFTRCRTVAARRSLLWKTASIVLTGGILNWALFFFFAHPVVLFVLGHKWLGSVPLFQAFASLSFAYAVGYLPSTLMQSAGRYREISLVRITCTGIFVGALTCFPAVRSPVAVAWIVQATWVIQGLALLFLYRDLLREQKPILRQS
jgi:teichuronic acid exporter